METKQNMTTPIEDVYPSNTGGAIGPVSASRLATLPKSVYSSAKKLSRNKIGYVSNGFDVYNYIKIMKINGTSQKKKSGW